MKWVNIKEGRYKPAPGDGLELEKLYVVQAARRHGLARRLLGLVEGEARIRQSRFLALWTDTRFEAAHAFYKAHGFRQTGLRELDDASQSVEYGFRKEL